MKLLRNIPLKRKLTLISMVTSCAAILLTCGVYVAYESIDARRSIEKEVLMTATIIGDNSAAALSFADPASAEQTLRTLGTTEHILAAFIYDGDGKLFAEYQPANGNPTAAPAVQPDGRHFTSDYLELFHTISAGGEAIGTVCIRHSMDELYANLQRAGFLVFGVSVAAALASLLLTRKLQPLVSRPIINLAGVVREVAQQQNFCLRAVKEGDDEVGSLIDGFNEMLEQVQQRDCALEAAKNELEQRVAIRTQELANSLSMLNATLESAADGVLAVDLAGKVICCNTRFAEMFAMEPQLLARKSTREMALYAATQVKNPRQFLGRIRAMFAKPGAEEFDVLEMVDGRTIERYIRPQLLDGVCVGLVGNFRDITDRKRGEKELEGAYKQLVETSRQAGMAEVATSVLHNVGNVLNSVNIACSVVSDKVRKSRIGSVAKTAELLRQHQQDLAGFLASHPAGQKLPAFLGKLSERLEQEQSEVLQELHGLSWNVEHIKDIISMQQDYARISGVTETLQVAALVEDSLRMNDGSLLRHDVEVIRKYDDVPPVTVEKHKVLQILVNLIRNAKHACEDSGRADKQMEVRVRNAGEHVHITVADNGVGISQENLTRIFAHGFTTKKDGHGFGLHSSVLAAEEMGGRLTVHSDGAGAGATFTLELPLGPSGNN